MIRITSLRNDKLGIDLPQMVFERRADDLLDFGVVRVTEKSIWHAIESIGIPYEDWVACKDSGSQVLDLSIELKNGSSMGEEKIARAIRRQITMSEDGNPDVVDDFDGYINFSVRVNLLPKGAFANYMSFRQAEGADLAHLKPPHVNPSKHVLSLLQAQQKTGKPQARKEPMPV
jgi:hypothetical protein